MYVQVEQWDESTAKEELPKRLKRAKEYRKKFERDWKDNESIINNPMARASNSVTVSYDSRAEFIDTGLEGSNSDISINYVFKYVRFIHSQMAANPPAVSPRATSSDPEDKRAAEVADALVHHCRKQYDIANKVDITSLETLTYGTGFTKSVWDPLLGDIADFDKKAGKVEMQGDIKIDPVRIWDLWIDPEARCWDDVNWTFERYTMNLEEAKARFPGKADLLEEISGDYNPAKWETRHQDDIKQRYEHLVEVYEYYERARPWNGMAGRHVYMTEDGEPLMELSENPIPDAQIPYHQMTDVDMPHHVYGRTFVSYLVRLQNMLNRLDSTMLENVQTHGIARLVVFDGAELEDEAITDSGLDVITVRGSANQAPVFMNPPQIMPDMHRFRQQLIEGMESLAGVNESMFGEVKREMSGYSLQTAINAGNLVRKRLFNKYAAYVESLYDLILLLIKENWTEKRKVLVVGEENAYSTAYFSGADIKEGYAFKSDYGTNLSLDPSSRQEQIMQLMPMFEKAGLDLRYLLKELKLSEISSIFEKLTVGRRRQQEIFDEMLVKYEQGETSTYIPPEEEEDHELMYPFAKEFRMSAEFKRLPQEVKDSVNRHIRERRKMMTAQAVPEGAAGQPPAPGQPPLPGGPGAAGAPPAGGLGAMLQGLGEST